MFKNKWMYFFFSIMLFVLGLNQLAYWGENTAGKNLHIVATILYFLSAVVFLFVFITKKLPLKKQREFIRSIDEVLLRLPIK